jgi:hypothetical protein
MRQLHAEHFANYDQRAVQWDVTEGPADDASRRFSVLEDLKEADARLFAAAPRLLAACEALLARHDDSNFGRWCWCEGGTPEAPLVRCEACALRRAVANAKGATQ